MSTFKGVVFLGDRRLEVRDFPLPEPEHGEVLLRIMASGICGSDLHVYRSSSVPGQIAGHEPAGVVEKLGPGIKRLKVGDRVSVHHHNGCGVCQSCARGEVVACQSNRVYGVGRPGSFAQYMTANEANCIPLPDGLSFIDGAFMACVGTTAYAALRRLEARAHESLAVYGLGPVGLSCIIVARAMGLRVVGIDINAERVELARRCGAHLAISSAKQDPVAAVREFARIPGVPWVDGIDYVIETSGSTAARECIIPSLRRLGKAAVVGVGSTEKVIDPSEIHGRAVTLIGSVVFPLGWSWDFAAFLAAGGIGFEPAVTHRFAIEEAEEALRLADEGIGGKIVFTPHG